VVTLTADHHAFGSQHEHATRAEVARRLAALQRFDFCGEYDPHVRYAPPLYFVPSDTLGTLAAARALGIAGANDLFGGVVPQPFVATKAITHALPSTRAARPAGWKARFAAEVADVVLPGYCAFSRREAQAAGERLLRQGTVRVKPVCATGGRGQTAVHDGAALADALSAMDEHEIATHGVVLEENLDAPVTCSVGQVVLGPLTVSYHGVQRLTIDNRSSPVYGGSDLTLVRGRFDALLALPLAPEVRLAVTQACHYHRTVQRYFRGFFASRTNYDIAQGNSPAGEWRSGVLEQSWRLGGASGAEVAALERFHADPDCRRVRAATFEVYGGAAPPAGAAVYFHGTDAQAGLLAKYAMLESYADTP